MKAIPARSTFNLKLRVFVLVLVGIVISSSSPSSSLHTVKRGFVLLKALLC